MSFGARSSGFVMFLCPLQHPNSLALNRRTLRALKRMNRDLLKQHFLLAEKHIAEGTLHVERQRRIVENLQHDLDKSADLLELFEETLRTHIDERDRLVAALAERP